MSIKSKLDLDRATRVPFGKTADIAATDVQRAIEAVLAAAAADLAAHLADTSDAHDASAVSVTPTGALAATDAQAALAELDGDITTVAGALAAHIADASDAHDASAISYVGGTGMSATDVEAALDELANEKLNSADYTAADVLAKLLTVDGSGSGVDADLLDGQSSAFYATATSVSDHLADSSDAHDASAISFTPNGSIAATDVQTAIQEVRDEAQPLDATLTDLAALGDAGADSGLFWDESESSIDYWTPTGALSFSGTNLVVAAAAEGNTGTLELATDAEIRSATTGSLAITAADLETASAFVTITETGGSIPVDWDSFINGVVTIDENSTLANPSNGQPGTWRVIRIVGNDTTNRTLAFGNQYFGDLPSLTDIDDGVNYLLIIYSITSSVFVLSAIRSTGT